LASAGSRRVVLIVAVAALVAAGAIVGGTALQSRNEHTSFATQAGQPPIELEFGLRTDPEARALSRAQRLFDNDRKVAAAAAIFRRYHSVEAQLGLAFASWHGPASLAAVQQIAAAHPDNPAALLNLGWADYWAGRNSLALTAWERTARRYADSGYGVDAEDALHSRYRIPGLPVIVTGIKAPRSLDSFAAVKRAAAGRDEQAKLLYGWALWNLKMPLSAERQFVAAARLAPHDPLARTLAAVGLFSKADPARAFGRLGPLTAVFPSSPVVEFHLGVMLLWIGEDVKAAKHLRAVLAAAPKSPWATYARTLLASLGRASR
jgi:tetratricopeptide (TPR) repeat protein